MVLEVIAPPRPWYHAIPIRRLRRGYERDLLLARVTRELLKANETVGSLAATVAVQAKRLRGAGLAT